MSEATLIFPNQLFENHPALKKDCEVYLLEDDLFFLQYKFHKTKIAYHRATMKWYADYLTKKNFIVNYIEANSKHSNLDDFFSLLSKKGINNLNLSDVNDYLLERRLNRYSKKHKVKIKWNDNPNFLLSKNSTREYFNTTKKFFLTDFYIHFRKQLNILTEENKPVGGKWTFDSDNRKKMPSGTIVPALPKTGSNSFLEEGIKYVEEHFNNNPGESDNIIYPITFSESKKWLNHFLEERFSNYGIYQDAMVEKESFLFHSILTPMLNIGLLTPDYIIDKTLEHAENNEIPINSVEGFIRQVLGWREFIKVVYEEKGVFQRTNNHFSHDRKIPPSFYNGKTGIAPIDDAIKKTLKYGYAHHIERLMILGNFMLLCEFDPDEVYKWFMELYIDAYDWVMVPNVYGMSQYADAGLMSTKPYISGSNYILKMSNYQKGEWCEIWDALYWLFIIKHKNAFAKNPRMSMMVSLANKLSEEKIQTHKQNAEAWFKKVGIK